MSDITGGCLCGAVSFTVDQVKTDYHICHCGMCRRWAGGPLFASSVENIRFQGEDNISRFKSSDWAERGFCKVCGSNLFYLFKEQNLYVVSLGAFDDQSSFHVAGEIYIDAKPAGYEIAGDHPRLTEEEFLAKFMSS